MTVDSDLLHEAVRFNDTAKIEQLLSEGANVNHKSSRSPYNTPLYLAIHDKHQESAIVLIKHGGTEFGYHFHCDGLLHNAAAEGCDKVVEWLIRERGFDANKTTSYGQTALHSCSSVEVAKVLLAHGSKINAKNEFGATALHDAMRVGDQDIARLLIQNGIDVNSPDTRGRTALHLAVSEDRSNLASVRLLLANGANVNAKTSNGENPLHCLHRNILYDSLVEKDQIIGELLRCDIEIDAQDNVKGWTPLHRAVKHPEAVRMYLEKGADINIKSNEGYSPLQLAEEFIKKTGQLRSSYMISRKRTLMLTSEYLVQYIIKLRVAGLYVSGENLRLVESILSRPDRSNQRSYEQRCKLELAMFKTHTGLGLNCLLTTRYPTYVSNKDLCDRIERLVDGVNYPIYGERVLKKFKHDKGRFRFMELYKNLMIQSKLKPTLPEEIWVKILSHLTDEKLPTGLRF